jgi:hypothetical protein
MSAFKMKMQGGKITEEKLWSNTDNSVGFNTPILKDGLVFGLSGGDQIFCIDTQTQKTKWSAPMAKPGADQPANKSAAGAPRDGKLPARLAQFVQQDQPKNSNERDRPDSGPRRGPGPDGGRGFGGPGRGMGRGGMGGMTSRGYGSIVDAGSVLLALAPAGELVVFKPAGEAFAELARYKVADGGTYAYPIPAGKGIYVKDKDSLTLWTID